MKEKQSFNINSNCKAGTVIVDSFRTPLTLISPCGLMDMTKTYLKNFIETQDLDYYSALVPFRVAMNYVSPMIFSHLMYFFSILETVQCIGMGIMKTKWFTSKELMLFFLPV